MGTRGPIAKGSQPSRSKFKCPVDNCLIVMRGDNISRHFKENDDLIVLDKAVENLSQLKKRKVKKVAFSCIILEIQLQIGIKNCMI